VADAGWTDFACNLRLDSTLSGTDDERGEGDKVESVEGESEGVFLPLESVRCLSMIEGRGLKEDLRGSSDTVTAGMREERETRSFIGGEAASRKEGGSVRPCPARGLLRDTVSEGRVND